MSKNSVVTYDAPQLSVPPSSVRVPADLVFRQTLGSHPPEAVAALIIFTIQEHALGTGKDEWVGFSTPALAERAGQIIRMRHERCLPTLFDHKTFNTGLKELHRRQLINVKTLDEGLGEFDVVTVNEALLKQLAARYIV